MYICFKSFLNFQRKLFLPLKLFTESDVKFFFCFFYEENMLLVPKHKQGADAHLVAQKICLKGKCCIF